MGTSRTLVALPVFLCAAIAQPAARAEDCGLEPPGSPPWHGDLRRPFELGKGAAAGPFLRRVVPEGPPSANQRQAPWGARGAGFLSGKTVYLSPGHGFTSYSWGWSTQRGNTNSIIEDLVSAESVQQLLVRYLWNAGARVVTVREADLGTRLAIVDEGDTDGAFSRYVEQGAPSRFRAESAPGWGRYGKTLTGSVNPFALGRSRTMESAPRADASALFIPEIPEDGEYHVYVAYVSGPDRPEDVHYVVRHPGGEAHFRLDQRRHGGTWVLLGRFHFERGLSPSAGAVVVSNDSAAPGRRISLDAVRFGGGMGDVERGKGVSGRPRFEEMSRYYAQFAGAPPAVYDNEALSDREDDVGTRSRFAAWDHEEGEDAVYVAWHTNAPSPRVGTSSYVYGPNPPDGSYEFTGVPGSDRLQTLIHDEIISNLRRGYAPEWKNNGKYTAYFGELNPRHNPETPAVLVEVAFHDTAADAFHLRQPRFRDVVTRAMYQGIARFFAERDGRPVALLPEPPQALCARGSGAGEITLTWHPPPVGPAGLSGDRPARYRVYRSRDGRAFDEGTDVAGTRLVIAGATPATTLYFRVSAVNAGGESFPSQLVAVRPSRDGRAARVLLVGGFDRLDGDMLVREDLSRYSLGVVQRMLLHRMNHGGYLAAHASAMARSGMSFDSCQKGAIGAGDVRLLSYPLLDWQMGEQSSESGVMSEAERAQLVAYLDGGGRLILSGSEGFRALSEQGRAEQDLMRRLGVRFARDDAETYGVVAAAGGIFAGMADMSFDNGEHGTYDVDHPDVLDAQPGGRVELFYAGSAGAAAVSNDAHPTIISIGFPLETIFDEETRAEVFARMLAALGVEPDDPPGPEGPSGAEPTGQQENGPPSLEQGCACRAAPGPRPGAEGTLLLGLFIMVRLRPPSRPAGSRSPRRRSRAGAPRRG